MPTVEPTPLTEHDARRILAEIDRLYHLLPSEYHERARYTALEHEIRSFADQFRAYEAAREAGEPCRMARAAELQSGGTMKNDHDDPHSRR